MMLKCVLSSLSAAINSIYLFLRKKWDQIGVNIFFVSQVMSAMVSCKQTYQYVSINILSL